MRKFAWLFSPVQLGGLKLPNRVVMAPMGTGYADEEHKVTDRLIAYHVARARGGVGLNIIEHTAVHRLGLTGARMLAILDDSFIPGFRSLTDAIHEAGGRAALQLQHGGRQASPDVIGQETLSPSAIAAGRDGRIPKEMTVKQIRQAVAAFGEGARRAQEAGFDGVEVHMAHGYLGCSFLSPLLNQRTDLYGGDTVKRTRFASEVMQAIRKQCGEEFPVWCRVSADEYIKGGQSAVTMQAIAPILQHYGYCALHVSACIGETAHYASAPYLLPQGHLLSLAESMARFVDIPVIGVGSIVTPDVAEHAIINGHCELVALGRALLADPEWCNKARGQREPDITPCILCNLGCLDRRHSPDGALECVTNPATGREEEWSAEAQTARAKSVKRILVVGGGPTGMTAATAAARRGHDVTLWEAGPTLGGRLAQASYRDRGEVFDRLLKSLAGGLDAAGVDVAWQQRGDLYKVAAMRPDALIVATGARPLEADEALVEGAEGEVLLAAHYLQNPDIDVDHLVAVLGGDETGCVAALELAGRGHRVMIFERNQDLGHDMVSSVRHFIIERIAQRDIQIYTGCEVLGVSHGKVLAKVPGNERKEFPPAGVMAALGRRSVDDLSQVEARLGIPVHVIGDAREPGTLHDALWEGAELGRQI